MSRHIEDRSSISESSRSSRSIEERQQQQQVMLRRKVLLTNSDIVLGSLKLPEGNVDGDTTLTLGFQLVEDPCVLEGTLAEFGGFLERALAFCKREIQRLLAGLEDREEIRKRSKSRIDEDVRHWC
jgi:hypothetical protein